jgi:hypothetical protein
MSLCPFVLVPIVHGPIRAVLGGPNGHNREAMEGSGFHRNFEGRGQVVLVVRASCSMVESLPRGLEAMAVVRVFPLAEKVKVLVCGFRGRGILRGRGGRGGREPQGRGRWGAREGQGR